METKIVQWVHCDDKIKEYNQKSKSIKEMKDKLSVLAPIAIKYMKKLYLDHRSSYRRSRQDGKMET